MSTAVGLLLNAQLEFHSPFEVTLASAYKVFIEDFMEFATWFEEDNFDMSTLVAMAVKACTTAGIDYDPLGFVPHSARGLVFKFVNGPAKVQVLEAIEFQTKTTSVPL